MPRLNDDGRGRLTGSQRAKFGELLMDAFTLSSFDNMLANRLGIDREDIALGDNKATIVFRVIGDAERKWYTACSGVSLAMGGMTPCASHVSKKIFVGCPPRLSGRALSMNSRGYEARVFSVIASSSRSTNRVTGS